MPLLEALPQVVGAPSGFREGDDAAQICPVANVVEGDVWAVAIDVLAERVSKELYSVPYA